MSANETRIPRPAGQLPARSAFARGEPGTPSVVEIALRAQRAGASLARWLAPWTFVDWSAARVTSELTRAVVAWGVAHRWRVRQEVPSLAGLPGDHPDQSGYLDVVCERLDGSPIAIEIEIEIDRTVP